MNDNGFRKDIPSKNPGQSVAKNGNKTVDYEAAKLRKVHKNFSELWHSYSLFHRVGYLGLVALFVFSLLAEQLLFISNIGAITKITPRINSLLVKTVPGLEGFISFDSESSSYEYNKGYQIGNGYIGTKSSPKFSGVFPIDGSEGVTVNDPSSGSAIKITPKFGVGFANQESNRLVYPLKGKDALKVISLGAIGYKEDIVLNSYQGSVVEFAYDLDVPEGVEARLETDGSIGFYGVSNELLGNVSTNTEEDAELLEKALQNGEKNNLLFKVPAPYVLEYGRNESVVDTYFKLEGNTLTTVATNLAEAQYPLTIDPSVYVETARKFLRGNEETNVDFDVDNELIQKGTTTGARFDNWVSTLSLNEALYDGGSVMAGGYTYYIGGAGSAGAATSTEYSTAGSSTYNVPSGIDKLQIEMWGAGGGGGGGGTDGPGGHGGGGAYATAIIDVTALETLNVVVGGGGGGGDFSSGGLGYSGDGGGGGGHSEVNRGGTHLIVAAGGGGGGGGDNSSTNRGGQGAGGGDETSGNDGGDGSANAPGGSGASTGSGGSGGNGDENDGDPGGFEFGGDGADGATNNSGSDGSANNGGSNGGGPGGIGDDDGDAGFAAGGGGGSGRYGGGGGSGADSGQAGGGGGGSGVSYFEGGATNTSAQAGSGSTPGNDADGDRSGAGAAGTGGSTSSSGTDGADGKIIITPYLGNEVKSAVYWASINSSTGGLESPNPGSGACAEWCTNSDYDLPEERRGFSLIAYNGFLYVIGGEDDSGNIEDTVFIAKIGANGEPSLWHPTDSDKSNWVYWYEDASGSLTTPTRYGAAIAYNNRIYHIGGETSGSPGGVTTVEYTDISPTGTITGWTSTGTAALSTSRFMHTVEVYNDYLYVIGGDSSSTGSLLNTVDYVKLASDGTFDGSWQSTSSFSGGRRTNGGDFSTIYGAYIYVAGGCTSVSSGDCQGVGDEIQIASIFADGSLGDWSTDTNETNQRASYGLHSWQGHVYALAGCAATDASGECASAFDSTVYGEINPPGEVSTVNITESYGSGNCVGSTPQDCDLPATGDGSGQGGQMLSMSVVLNGYLYVIGGCTNYGCSGSSGNVSYVQIGSDGSLQQESTCVANGNTYANGGNSAWCVDSSNRVNGTSGISAAGVTIFENKIFLVGGIDGSNSGTQRIYWNSVNTDGSLSGSWSSRTLSSAGITAYSELSYTYAYARANPNSAGSSPGNLYVIGGCTSFSASAGCSSAYATEVYKCNISSSGDVTGCSTSGQLQIDSELASESNQGLGLHSGTVYANYIYLIGGYSDNVGDRDTVFYAKFNDSNNIVDAVSGTAILADPDDDWIESNNDLGVGRRRGWAFGYNGHIYAVGGYDDTGTGIIPFIEWGKLNVSDGSLDEFVTSTITINQRWGLSMVVSNSFAYVIGGCDVGSSPGGCSSFEPSVQTFQLYNNDSGAQANYTEQVGNFETNNSRIGSSSAILDGYIYVAGGETSSTATNNVQYAKLNSNGTIGTWSDTSATLPAARAYGQLEVVGDTLYYVGGEDSGGDEKSDVYYAIPTTGASSSDTIRTTTYKISGSEFSGTNYTLTLDDDLESDYFVMVAGGDDSGNTSGPDHSQVRVDGDPFGNLTATTNSDELRLERGNSTSNWVGTVTVVECVSSCTTDGFQLSEVIDGALPASDLSEDFTLSSNHSTRTVPFGGYLGGGLSTAEASQNNFSATAGVRVRKNSTNQIRVERDDTVRTAAAADITIYVVEWGSNWNVEEVDFDDWNTGGVGVNDSGEYTTQTISSVTRDNTWVWKSPGTSEEDGLGDGSFGKVLTLGDGTSTQNASETTVALGSRHSAAADVRSDTVYVMEHSSLATDYRFETESNKGSSFTATVDSAIESESVSTAGNITTSAGYRVPLFYYSDSGTGTAYTRVAGWSNYFSNDTTVSLAKSYSGNSQAGWLQSVDFGNFAGSSGGGDITTWSTASNGLPGDRTKHGAAVWNDRIYVVGGLDNSASETNTVYISPKLTGGGDITSAWVSDADVPDVARSGAALIAYANNLYLLGGNDGSNYLSDVQFASIGYKTGTISQTGTTLSGSGTSWNSNMVGSQVQYADGSYATVTGYTNATTLTVDASKTVDPGSRYLIDDGSVGNWTFTTNLTQQVSDADGFASNGFIYLFGGRSATSTCTNNSYVAPISANTTIDSGNNPTGIGEWYQTNVEFSGTRYSSAVAYNEGKVYISGGGCGTELTSNQHYIGTLRAQPQVARYSYYVDADSNVFPNAWLLNGLDNNIGARWQFGYRSAATTPDISFQETFDSASNGSSAWGADDYPAHTPNTNYDTCYVNNGTGSASKLISNSWNVTASNSITYATTGGTGNTACIRQFDDISTDVTNFDRFYINMSSAPTSATNIYLVQKDNVSGTVASLQVAPTTGNLIVKDRFTAVSALTMGTGEHRIEVGIVDDQILVKIFSGSNIHGYIPDETTTVDLDDPSGPDEYNEIAYGIAQAVSNWSINFDEHKSSRSNWVGSVYPGWGQNTDFGDVQLGRVEPYIAKDASGVDTEFARYFYVTVSIDASQTFGYPDDVTRGPTVSDMSIFFVSDPNKRLRHGKTFIQGLEQPLDTPCRVSGANPAGSQPNCPMP